MNGTENIIKTLGRNALYNYAGRTVVTLMSATIFIYIARNLSIVEYGLYSLFSAILIFFAVFLPLGFPSSILRFVPEFVEKKNYSEATQIVKKSLLIVFGWGGLFLSLSIILSKKMGGLFSNLNLQSYLTLLTAIGIIGAEVAILENVLSSFFLQGYKNLYESIASIAQFILVVTVLQYGYGLYGLILSIGIANLLLFTLYFHRTSTVLFKDVSVVEIKVDYKRFFRFSFNEYLFRALAFFWDIVVDIYIITYLLGSAAAGLFGFASSISLFLMNWSPGIALQTIIRPLFVRQYTKSKSDEEINYLFRFYNKFKAFFVFPAIVGMWLLIDKFILIIFQPKFLPAANTFRILLFFVMLQGFLQPIRNIFNVLERNEIPVYSNVVVPYRLLASFFLIKYYGIEGAAWAFGSSIAMIFLIQYIWAKRIANITFPYKSFLKIGVNSLIMGVAVFIFRSRITNVLTLCAAVILSLVIYILSSYLNKAFEEDERALLNKSIGFNIWHF